MAEDGRLGDMELHRIAVQTFGLRRVLELYGYALMFALAGIDPEEVPKIVEALKGAGVSRSAVYKAFQDFRTLRDVVNEYKSVRQLQAVTLGQVVHGFRPGQTLG